MLGNLREVMRYLWSEGQTNWVRAIALFSFVEILAMEITEIALGMENVESLAQVVANHLEMEGYNWVKNQGTWQGFLNHLQASTVEQTTQQATSILSGLEIMILQVLPQ